MISWTKRPLRELTSKIGSGATPRGGNSVYGDYQTSFIRSQNVYDLRFEKEGLAHISPTAATELRNVAVEPNDVLINITGESVTRTCLVDSSVLPARVSQHVAIVRAQVGLLDPKFLLYSLLAPSAKLRLNSLSEAGATRRALTKGHLESFEIPVPPIDEQERIASVLGAFDELIETDKSLSVALIETARQTYAQLLQRSSTAPFDSVFEVIGGGTPKTSKPEYWNGETPWFAMTDLPDPKQAWVTTTAKHVTDQGVAKSSTRVLPVETVILTARGTVGRLALTAVPMCMNQSCYGIRSMKSLHGYYPWFTMEQLIADLRARAHGSVFDTITRGTLSGLNIPAPTDNEIANTDAVVRPLMRSALELIIEAQELSLKRDELLPLLMSGQVRVSDLEEVE